MPQIRFPLSQSQESTEIALKTTACPDAALPGSEPVGYLVRSISNSQNEKKGQDTGPDPFLKFGLIRFNQLLTGSAPFLKILQNFVEIEARRLLSLRIILEGGQETSNIFLSGHEQEGVVNQPIVVGI